VDRAAFDHVLVQKARKALTVLENHVVKRIQIAEEGVVLEAAGQEPVRGRFLVIAAGLQPQLLEEVGLRGPQDAQSMQAAFIQASVSKRKQPRVTVVIGVPDIHGFAICVERGAQVSVSLHSRETADTLPSTLAGVCGGLFRANLLDMDLTAAAVAAEITTVFPFSALEMESHVGKHTLLVGDAGGFLSIPRCGRRRLQRR
jgi:flavin-dependent dehydrogenase